jgi:hypothetical protein
MYKLSILCDITSEITNIENSQLKIMHEGIRNKLCCQKSHILLGLYIIYLLFCMDMKLGLSHLRIFGPKRQEVTGGWRRLHNEELQNLFTSPILLGWSNQWGWDVQGEMWNAYKV